MLDLHQIALGNLQSACLYSWSLQLHLFASNLPLLVLCKFVASNLPVLVLYKFVESHSQTDGLRMYLKLAKCSREVANVRLACFSVCKPLSPYLTSWALLLLVVYY